MFRRHPATVQRLEHPVPERGEQDAFPFPAPRRGQSLVRDDAEDAAPPADAAHELHILHDRELPVAADQLEVFSSDEDRLVAEGDAGDPCTQSDIAFGDPKYLSGRPDAQIKAPCQVLCFLKGLLYARECVPREKGVGVEEQEDVPFR
jgi:hypothetical protein